MPNSHPDDSPVTWGRYTAERDALTGRVDALETALSKGKDRRWTLTVTILASLALPIVVLTIGVFIHRALNA